MAFTLKRLSELNAVSGNEDEARRYILSEIKAKCDRVDVDSMGNVTAFKRGMSDKYKILIGTNIDEAGFIVSEITDTGYIKFKPVGAIDPRTLVSKRVIIGGGVKGVIGMKAIHLQKKSEREAAVETDGLYIDIGAKNKKAALKHVSLGDYITFDTKFSEPGDCVKGKALDRFGAVCLTAAMDEAPAYDTYFVFSVQREIPCSIPGRGMRIAAYRIKPDYALIVDTVSAADTYKSEQPAARLGEGAVIEYMDKTSIADTRLTAAVADMAVRSGIKIQNKTSSVLTTIAGAAVNASSGTAAAVVGIPCRYSHTPVSLMNKNDINAVTALCCSFVKESDVIIDEITQKAD
ncbi:MAG: M42 family peptidase [Clostridiales bacterium]|nr:M42 family peptidase [Clostridiales bacterium]